PVASDVIYVRQMCDVSVHISVLVCVLSLFEVVPRRSRLLVFFWSVYSCFFCLFYVVFVFFFFSSRRRHTRCYRDWSSDVCSSDLLEPRGPHHVGPQAPTVERPQRVGDQHDPRAGRELESEGRVGLIVALSRDVRDRKSVV